MPDPHEPFRPLFRLPRRGHITPVDPAQEPTQYYYWPVVGWFYSKRLQMILDLLAGRRYDALLEVAYGSGIFLPSLAAMCGKLHGIDLHTRIDLVQESLAKESVQAELISGDAFHMPYDDGTFDCVVNVSMLEHLDDPGAAIDEMLRILKPGGLLALGFPCRNLWMDAFFRALGFDPRRIHPSSHRDILDALKQRRSPVRLHTLPGWLPQNAALYCACTVTA